MYEGACAGLFLTGFYGLLALIPLIFGWRELEDWSSRFILSVYSLICIVGFGHCWNAKNVALERNGVISSCIEIREGIYQITDSTLRCNHYKDYPERYTILKQTRTISVDDQHKCLNCNKIMRNHVDDAKCTKTYDEIQAELMIDYLTAPL